jgi:hypothetical protein
MLFPVFIFPMDKPADLGGKTTADYRDGKPATTGGNGGPPANPMPARVVGLRRQEHPRRADKVYSCAPATGGERAQKKEAALKAAS